MQDQSECLGNSESLNEDIQENSDEFLKTLERLEALEKSVDITTLAQEYTEEKLLFFASCPNKLLARLFKLAHIAVSKQLPASKENTGHRFIEVQTIHPVYGAIINFFFQSYQQISPEIGIEFFYHAGEVYFKQQNYAIAMAFYQRAYQKCDTFQSQNPLTSFLKKKLKQLEALVYNHFFLQLGLNLQTDPLPEKSLPIELERFLTIVDCLIKEGLSKEAEDCYQVPILRRYLETLGLELQRLANDKDNLSQLYKAIADRLLPLAERINNHVSANGTLIVWLNHCYRLVYNTIRDHQLALPELNQQLMTHENRLFEKRKDSIKLQADLLPKLIPLWPSLMEKLNPLVAGFSSVSNEPLFNQPTIYTNTVKEVVHAICKQLKVLLGEPPCHFSLISFGSTARGEMLPNSDLDICLFIDADEGNPEKQMRSRLHPYFINFIYALNQLLKLCYGQWLCAKRNIDREGSAIYLRQETVYELVDTGLRIDSMDLDAIEAIINTPGAMANWVLEHSSSVNNELKSKHRIIAYGLLTPTALYSSNETGHPLFDAYITQLETHLSKSSNSVISSHQEQKDTQNHQLLAPIIYYLKEKKNEQSRLLNIWENRKKLSHDNAFLFIKDCLFVLDLWSTMMLLLTSRHRVFAAFSSTEQRLTKLIHSNNVATYFVHSVRNCRQLLLRTKYRIEDHKTYQAFVDWKQLELYFIHVILPITYHLQHYQRFAQEKWLDPYAEWLSAILKTPKDTLLAATASYMPLAQTVHWLQDNQAKLEDYKRLYTIFLSNDNRGEKCKEFIDYLINTLGLHALVAQTLIGIPNQIGYRQSERLAYERLFKSLLNITQENFEDEEKIIPKVELSWFDQQGNYYKRHLPSAIAKTLIEFKTLDVKKHYTSSLHRVAPIVLGEYQLHIKQFPGQPLTDYAVDILSRRLMGGGTSANTLARLTITESNRSRYYPVLISETVGGQTLRDILKKDPNLSVSNVYYTELVLIALLTMPGDGTSQNFIMSDNGQLTFIDLDQHFVEPIVKQLSLNGLNKVQFCHVLFCLAQANQALDKDTIQRFCALKHAYSVIQKWVENVSTVEGQYLQLFTESERKGLYTLNKEEKFSPLLLLKEGVLASLLINLNYLQIHLQQAIDHNKVPSALDLLTLINPRLGYYYQQAYSSNHDPEKRLSAVTDRSQQSIPSNLALQTSLGVVPSFDEIEKGECFTLKGAKKELLALLNFTPDFSKLVDAAGKPDKNRQLIVLKALALFPHEQLSLSHCQVLTDALLEEVLFKSTHLRELRLQGCNELTVYSLIYLSKNHSQLRALYFTDNTKIESVYVGTRFTKSPLYFPALEILHISRCSRLRELRINAPQLSDFKDQGCIQLNQKILEIKKPVKNHPANNTIKCVLVGDGGVGKDALVHFLLNKEPFNVYDPLGFFMERIHYMLPIKRKLYTLYLQTTAGQEEYDHLRPLSYPDTDIFLICFSIISLATFENVTAKWLPEVKYFSNDTPILLVGIKTDLRNEPDVRMRLEEQGQSPITYEQGIELAKKIGAKAYIECSAKTGDNVIQVFEQAVTYSLNYNNKINAFLNMLPNQESNMLGLTENGTLKLNITMFGQVIEDKEKYIAELLRNPGIKKLENLSGELKVDASGDVDILFSNLFTTNYQKIQTLIYGSFNIKESRNLTCFSTTFSAGILIYTSVSSREKFIEFLRDHNNDSSRYAKYYKFTGIFVLIGIHTGSRGISLHEATSLARQYGIAGYFECSLETGEGIIESFQGAIELIIENTGYWKWKGEKYIPSQSYLANKLLSASTKGIIGNEDKHAEQSIKDKQITNYELQQTLFSPPPSLTNLPNLTHDEYNGLIGEHVFEALLENQQSQASKSEESEEKKPDDGQNYAMMGPKG